MSKQIIEQYPKSLFSLSYLNAPMINESTNTIFIDYPYYCADIVIQLIQEEKANLEDFSLNTLSELSLAFDIFFNDYFENIKTEIKKHSYNETIPEEMIIPMNIQEEFPFLHGYILKPIRYIKNERELVGIYSEEYMRQYYFWKMMSHDAYSLDHQEYYTLAELDLIQFQHDSYLKHFSEYIENKFHINSIEKHKLNRPINNLHLTNYTLSKYIRNYNNNNSIIEEMKQQKTQNFDKNDYILLEKDMLLKRQNCLDDFPKFYSNTMHLFSCEYDENYEYKSIFDFENTGNNLYTTVLFQFHNDFLCDKYTKPTLIVLESNDIITQSYIYTLSICKRVNEVIPLYSIENTHAISLLNPLLMAYTQGIFDDINILCFGYSFVKDISNEIDLLKSILITKTFHNVTCLSFENSNYDSEKIKKFQDMIYPLFTREHFPRLKTLNLNGQSYQSIYIKNITFLSLFDTITIYEEYIYNNQLYIQLFPILKELAENHDFIINGLLYNEDTKDFFSSLEKLGIIQHSRGIINIDTSSVNSINDASLVTSNTDISQLELFFTNNTINPAIINALTLFFKNNKMNNLKAIYLTLNNLTYEELSLLIHVFSSNTLSCNYSVFIEECTFNKSENNRDYINSMATLLSAFIQNAISLKINESSINENMISVLCLLTQNHIMERIENMSIFYTEPNEDLQMETIKLLLDNKRNTIPTIHTLSCDSTLDSIPILYYLLLQKYINCDSIYTVGIHYYASNSDYYYVSCDSLFSQFIDGVKNNLFNNIMIIYLPFQNISQLETFIELLEKGYMKQLIEIHFFDDCQFSFIFQDDSRLDVKKSFLKVYPKCLLSCVAENPYTLIEDINCFYVDAMPFSIEYITKAGKYNYKSFDVLPREVLYNYLETLETYFPTATKVHSNFELYLQNYFYTLCENYLIEIIPFGKENSKDKCLVFLNINEWLCDRLKDCNFIIKKKQIKAIQLCLSKFSRNNMNSIFSQKLMQKYPDINQYIINVTESNNYLLLNFYDSSFIYNEEKNTNKDNLLEYIYFEGDDIQGFYKFLQNKEYKHLKSITIMSTNYDDCMKYIKEFNLFGIYVNIKIFDESLMESSSIIREKNINSLYISYSNIISKTIPKIDLSLSVTIFNDKNKYSTLKSLLLSDVNMFLSVIIYFDKTIQLE
ncbi:hypothetical protein WA158_004801 [Blastocystis sp. Blastoise]